MDKKQAIKLAHNYINRLNQIYEIKNVFLYGSFAKGTHHKDSDIDLAILLVSNKSNLDIQIDLMQERKDDELDIEPHPIKVDEFNVNNPIYDEILNTGIELIPETA